MNDLYLAGPQDQAQPQTNQRNTDSTTPRPTTANGTARQAPRRRPGVQDDGEDDGADTDDDSPVRGKRVCFENLLTGEAEPALNLPGKPLPLLCNKRAELVLRDQVEPVMESLLEEINAGVEDEARRWGVRELFEHLQGKHHLRPFMLDVYNVEYQYD